MTLTEREQFIVVLMAQRPTDNIAKKTRELSKEMRVGILKYIKNMFRMCIDTSKLIQNVAVRCVQ